MGLLDSIKQRVKKGTDTVVDTTAKVGNFMEEKSATLMEKVPGGHDLKEKANIYTEKTVNRIGEETKEMIKEGHEFVDAHMKKDDAPASDAKTDTVAPAAPAVTTPVTPAPVVAEVVPTPVVEPVHEDIKEEVSKDTKKHEKKEHHHAHKKDEEKKDTEPKKKHSHKKK